MPSEWLWSDTTNGGNGVEFLIADIKQYCSWQGQHLVYITGPLLPSLSKAFHAAKVEGKIDPRSDSIGIVLPENTDLADYLTDLYDLVVGIHPQTDFEPEGQYAYVFDRELLSLRSFLTWSSPAVKARRVFRATHARAIANSSDPQQHVDLVDKESRDMLISVTVVERPGPSAWVGRASGSSLVSFVPPADPLVTHPPPTTSSPPVSPPFTMLHTVLDPGLDTGDNPITIGINYPHYTEMIVLRPSLDPSDPGSHSEQLGLYQTDLLERVLPSKKGSKDTTSSTTLSLPSGVVVIDAEAHGCQYLAYDLDCEIEDIQVLLSSLPCGLDPELRCNWQTEEEVSGMRTVLRLRGGGYEVTDGTVNHNELEYSYIHLVKQQRDA